ncbi:hypothetical protein [Brevibacillus parabrevis]
MSLTTLDSHDTYLKSHILPSFGPLRINQIKTTQIVTFLVNRLNPVY